MSRVSLAALALVTAVVGLTAAGCGSTGDHLAASDTSTGSAPCRLGRAQHRAIARALADIRRLRHIEARAKTFSERGLPGQNTLTGKFLLDLGSGNLPLNVFSRLLHQAKAAVRLCGDCSTGLETEEPFLGTRMHDRCGQVGVRKGLAPDDLGDLLELPLLAVLATYRRDGTVLLSPVWHEWRDGGFNVSSQSRDVKVAHLRSNPRASIVVCEHRPPYRGIEVRAAARLSRPEDHSIVRRVAVRYLGAEAGERYAESGGDDVLIRLEPGELRAWDFVDYFA